MKRKLIITLALMSAAFAYARSGQATTLSECQKNAGSAECSTPGFAPKITYSDCDEEYAYAYIGAAWCAAEGGAPDSYGVCRTNTPRPSGLADIVPYAQDFMKQLVGAANVCGISTPTLSWVQPPTVVTNDICANNVPSVDHGYVTQGVTDIFSITVNTLDASGNCTGSTTKQFRAGSTYSLRGCSNGNQWTTDTTGQQKCVVASDQPAPCEKAGTCKPVDDPVSPDVMVNRQNDIDYVGGGAFPLQFDWFYSDRIWTLPGRELWRHSYSARIDYDASGTVPVALVTRDNGSAYFFTEQAGTLVAKPGVDYRLEKLVDANGVLTGWTLHTPQDSTETYDATGKLTEIETRSGLHQYLQYLAGDTSTPYPLPLPPPQLMSVTDDFGRSLQFSYDTQGNLVQMVDPAGNAIAYSWDGYGGLTSITYPQTLQSGASAIKQYGYGGFALLTSVHDENGDLFRTFAYNSNGAAIQYIRDGQGVYLYEFESPSWPPPYTTVMDPRQVTRYYQYQITNGVRYLSALASSPTSTTPSLPCPDCGPKTATYDANGNIATRVDWNDNRTDYTYDLTRDLETQRVEGLTAAGATTPQTRTISTQWHATWRLPVKVAEPLRITTYVYNGDGGASCGFESDGVTLVPGVLCSKTIQATTDADGSQGFSATPTGAPRTWSYTYNPHGRVLTVDGPRTDVADTLQYTYYADNDPDLGKRGQVATITNALGQVTQITAYNANAQPTTIVDPNGLTTTLTYNARMWLTSRDVGGEMTSYDYDGVGQLIKVTLPDGSFLSYTYNTSHYLTGIQDNLGNKIVYTVDVMGKRTQTQVFDPSSNLAQTRSRVYSNLNLLYQEIGATGQTTTYTYDGQGDVTGVTDPLNHTTTTAYDALNRVMKITDPDQGVTQYAYNGDNALMSVVDPRNLVTGYTVDGLGNLTQRASPDTGTTTDTYDAAGNLLTQTDAKGQTTTYAYDALNRVTSITFQDGSKQTYTYDQGTNDLGRLTGITETDPASQVTDQIDYAYDQHGRVTSDTRTVNGVAYATGYSYDSFGRLAGMTYPSGRTVTYSFDALGRVSEVDTTRFGQTQVVVQNVQYQPFGGVKGFTLGNGQVYSRTIDQDGRIASYTLGASTYDITFDDASRITGIAEAGNPSNANTYGYDSLDRLTSAVLPSTSYGYSYDGVGNRLSKTVGASTDTYAYSSTSNRIASITPATGPVRNFTFDADGSTTDDSVNQYAYDTRGRMVQATTAQGTTTYKVNALGQRFRKTSPTDDRVFLYDIRGHLIAETDPAGTLKRELLYLGDIPVGVLQ